jgi:hypothetical protein
MTISSNFVFFNDVYVQDEGGSGATGFSVLSNNSIVVMGNPFHDGSQTYLKKVSVDGTVLATGNVPGPQSYDGIQGAALATLANGGFAIVGQGFLGNGGLDIKYNVYDANLNAKFQTDREVLTIQNNDSGSQVSYSIFSTTNGFGIATTDSYNGSDTVSGLPGTPGTAGRGSDVRDTLYGVAGTAVTTNFLAQSSGSGLAGDQGSINSVQLSNGNIASVFGDTAFFAENSTGPNATTPHQFYGVSIANASGQIVGSPHDFAGTEAGDPGVLGADKSASRH